MQDDEALDEIVVDHDRRWPSRALGPADDAPVLFERKTHAVLRVSGTDSVAFLQAHLSADVGPLRPGDDIAAAMLAPKGQLLSLVRVLRRRHGFTIDGPAHGWAGLIRALERGRVGWQVEVADQTADRCLLSLVGSRAAGIVGLDEGHPPGRHSVARIAGHAVIAIGTEIGLDILCRSASSTAIATALRAEGALDGSSKLWEQWRLERGEPEFGVDVGTRTLPLEAGLVPTVVQLNGRLYPGLQTTLRQHDHGRVHRRVYRLHAAEAMAMGDIVCDHHGHELGHVTSAAVSPERGATALAFLQASTTVDESLLVSEADAIVTGLVSAGAPDRPHGTDRRGQRSDGRSVQAMASECIRDPHLLYDARRYHHPV